MYTTELYYHQMGTVAQPHPEANKVIDQILETTTPAAFEELCKANPQFDIKQRTVSSFGNTALHAAVRAQNVELTSHLVAKFGSEILSLRNSNYGSQTVLNTAILSLGNNRENYWNIIKILISLNVNVNDPWITDMHGYQLLNTPLDYALCNSNRREVAKLLLHFGAQRGVYFTAKGTYLLNEARKKKKDFNLLLTCTKDNKLVRTMKVSWTRKILAQLEAEVYAEKFQFFVGLKDSHSCISCLPQELINQILTIEKRIIPCFKQKALEKLAQAKRKICQNEILFLCAQSDKFACVSNLPSELIKQILKTRICLNMP